MAPYEEARLLSDMRPVETIVEKSLISHDAKGISVDGRRIGVFTKFYDHCKKLGISLKESSVPDRRVVEIRESYVCPVRKREVLFAGCTYDSPVCLLKLEYSPRRQPHEQFFTPIVHESFAKDLNGWKKATEAHDSLVRELDRKIVFSFNKSRETMSVNGRRLVKSVPALILLDVVRQHVATGKTEFVNRDFTSEANDAPALSQNFSLRLQRLSSVLSDKCPEVSLKRSGRGQFTFQPPCKVELRED